MNECVGGTLNTLERGHQYGICHKRSRRTCAIRGLAVDLLLGIVLVVRGRGRVCTVAVAVAAGDIRRRGLALSQTVHRGILGDGHGRTHRCPSLKTE